MFDFQRFDEWVEVHDNDDEARELFIASTRASDLLGRVFGASLDKNIAKQIIHQGLNAAYGSIDSHPALKTLEVGTTGHALDRLSSDVDLNHFDFGKKITTLKCYAMTGMLEGEASNDTLEIKHEKITELLMWAEYFLDEESFGPHVLPQLYGITSAASTRYSLDLNQEITVEGLSHLLSLFRDSTPEQIRKTLQNQISSKQIEIDEHRRILPDSAMRLLKDEPSFPSIWMIPDEPENDDVIIEEPVFIPVVSSFPFALFIPSQKHEDGYRIGSGPTYQVIDDYWDALAEIARLPEPAFMPIGSENPVVCKDVWMRVDKQALLSELNAMETASSLGQSLTDQVHQRLLSKSDIQAHPSRHTGKMYRYLMSNGTELALEILVGAPSLFVRLDIIGEIDGIKSNLVKKTGRHSNLEALPTFKDKELRRFKIQNLTDLDTIIGIIRRQEGV